MIAGIMLPPSSSSSSDDVGAEVAGTGVGAGVGALEVGVTAGKISTVPTVPVAKFSGARPIFVARLVLMALVRLDVSAASVPRFACKAVAAGEFGGTAKLNSTFSVPLK